MFGTKEVTTITNTPMPFWLKQSLLEFNFYVSFCSCQNTVSTATVR